MLPQFISFLLFVVFRGFTAIINDNLISNVFQLTVIILGICSGVCGYVVACFWTAHYGQSNVLVTSLTIFGFLSGSIVGMLLSSMLSSATAMVFVCFAEDPDILKVW